MRRIVFAVVVGAIVPIALAGDGVPQEAISPLARKTAVVEIGRRLFMDESFSRAGKFSCASCHDPEHGFSDPRKLSLDENGPTLRHSQPVTDLAGDGFHWDGEFDDVRQLLVSRIAPVEDAAREAMARLTDRASASRRTTLKIDDDEYGRRRRVIQSMSTPPYYSTPVNATTPSNRTPIVARLLQDGRYERGFRAAFSTAEPAPSQVIDAMAAYLETLQTGESAYDRFLAGDARALGPEARRGLELFRGDAGCAECHDPGKPGERATLTDGKFHNTGVAANRETDERGRKDSGQRMQSFLPSDTGLFKTASLRDVARRPPYMHDGSLATLAEVVDYYAAGGTANPHLDERVRPLKLTAGDKADLVAFLESLSAGERAGLGELHPVRAERLRVRIVDLRGKPIRRFAFTAVAAGDRLAGGDAIAEDAERQLLVTDSKGFADVAMPASTHVRLSSNEYEIGLSRPIPDWTEEMTLMATPRDQVAVVVRQGDRFAPVRGSIELYDPVRVEGKHRMLARLKRVRAVSPDAYLYAVDVGELRGDEVVGVLVRPANAKGSAFFVSEVDLGGGQSEPIDLRFGPTRRVGPRQLRRYGHFHAMPATPAPE